MARILIKNGTVWDGNTFYEADVLTNNDKILSIEKNIANEADFVYDASGKIVSPGLVDVHVHMQGTSVGNFGINAEMSCLPFGVTAAADAGRGIESRLILDNLGIKGLVFVYAQMKNNRFCTDDVEELLNIYGDKAIGIKVYFDTEMSDVCDITPLKEAVRFARERKLIVMVHCANSPVPMAEIISALGEGDILTHTYHGGANNAGEDGFECIKTAKERGIITDIGFAGHVHTDFGILRRAIECGAIPDTISTDITKWSAYKRGGRYGMTMCMSIAEHLGMPREEVFRAVTSSPAKVLGKADEWGRLSPGRISDISVFEYVDEGYELCDAAGNIVKSENGYRCTLTVSNGEVVYRR